MFKKSCVYFSIILSSQIYAGELVDSAHDLKMLSAKILKLSERVEYGNSSNALRRKLKSELTDLIQTGKSMRQLLGGGNGGGPGGPNPPSRIMYEAKCHIDDDPIFDMNQNVIDVRSYSVQGLISDCKQMAQAMYPTRSHSSGIASVVASNQAPVGMQSGRCHIDDDPIFDFNQFDIGTIYGDSVIDIIADCEAIASDAFGSQGSAGLKTVNANNPVPHGSVSGICHIDDDPIMDFNQFVPGVVFGPSIQAISADCKALAESAFGSNSAHGLKEIRY